MWWNRPVKTEPSSSELLVIAAIKPWACASCTAQFGRGNLLTMDDAGPLCMDCADLGHLEYLPRGDAALTRRAKRGSRLSAVVVQWSRARQRYERQGILAEVEAIAQAERECLADSECANGAASAMHGDASSRTRGSSLNSPTRFDPDSPAARPGGRSVLLGTRVPVAADGSGVPAPVAC